MANENQTMSQKDYLQRYLSGDDAKKKKAKKQKSKKISAKKHLGLKIIDTDIDIKSIDVDNDIEDECGDEAPVVAEIIDERPKKIQQREQYHSTSWKRLGSSDEEQSPRNNAYGKLSSFESHSARHDSDSDLSPARTVSKTPLKEIARSKKINDSDGDISPPRNRNASHRTRHDSDNDISTQSKIMHTSKTEKGHTKKYSDLDSDLSPPRTHSKVTRDSAKKGSLENNHKNKRNSVSDLSPERGRSGKKHSNQQELSVHIRKSNLKSSKGAQIQRSDSDYSPPRKTSKFRELSSDRTDFSRRNIASNSHSRNEKRKSLANSESTDRRERPSTTLSGLTAGLQNASTLRAEAKKLKKRETKHIMEMDDEISGRNAETIHRDRTTGRRRDMKEEQRQKDEVDQKLAERKEKYSEWGKGLEQRNEQKQRLEKDAYEVTKPLARYRDDEDLDRELRDEMREDDPMFEYMQKKKKKQQNIPEFPTYVGPPAPPNRFNVQPGYRWDGVDRSNGFEKRYFEKLNSAKSKETEKHLWSVQDM